MGYSLTCPITYVIIAITFASMEEIITGIGTDIMAGFNYDELTKIQTFEHGLSQ